MSPSYVLFRESQWKLVFEVILLTADLPAKSSLLNMQQFNAYYGCTLCNVECLRGDNNLYYLNQRFPMRTPEDHETYLQFIADSSCSSYKGVKGPAKIFDIVPKLPLSAPRDYMHQILLSAARTVLYIIKESFKRRLAGFDASLRGVRVISLLIELSKIENRVYFSFFFSKPTISNKNGDH